MKTKIPGSTTRVALCASILLGSMASLPLQAEDDTPVEEFKPYALHQGGDWPADWPKELDSLRHYFGRSGRLTWTIQRRGEPLIHYGIKFTKREEFEEAWPHLLKVKSEGAPIILRRGASQWLGGVWHGVCIHTPDHDEIEKHPFRPEELEKAPWKAKNYIELIVDGEIINLDRLDLSPDIPIIDERHPGADLQDIDGPNSDVAPKPVDPEPEDDNSGGRKLRDFTPDDPILSMYDYLWVELTDPEETEAVKNELAKYGRVVKGYGYRVWGADVFNDVDTAVAKAALAKLKGVGETGTHKRGQYDKRIPDLEASLRIGRNTYSFTEDKSLNLAFFLTNTSKDALRTFRSVDSSLCSLELKLDGPGAISEQIVRTHESSLALKGVEIRLDPGESYKIPLNNLIYGDEYNLHQWRWTEPGDYTLSVAYKIGDVLYKAHPVKLVVVD